MTTSNRIITNTIDSAFSIPLETLHNKNDSITYVFKKQGLKTILQEVQIGATNNNEAVILLGLDGSERIFLSVPDIRDEEETINLLAELDGKRNIEKEPEVAPEPAERTITLPDGRKITVPADFDPSSFRNRRQGGGNGQSQRPAQGDSTRQRQTQPAASNSGTTN